MVTANVDLSASTFLTILCLSIRMQSISVVGQLAERQLADRQLADRQFTDRTIGRLDNWSTGQLADT